MKSFFAHETSVIDSDCKIGKGTSIWHFSHIMSNCTIGENCNLGQNVVISTEVALGNNVKVQNNVSIYTGVICEDDVFLGPSMVFTNIINPRSAIKRKDQYLKRSKYRSQCHHCLWNYYWRICFCRRRSCGLKRSITLCFSCWKSFKTNWLD